jgi:hypothetical protein
MPELTVLMAYTVDFADNDTLIVSVSGSKPFSSGELLFLKCQS